jgi:CubicO group peptidase (beta-lactamase class C family)
MLLVQDGLLELEAPVHRYLPEWTGSPAKDSVTVMQLLTHTAGLPAGRPFWRDARGKEEYLQRIAALPLEYTPGSNMVYSDLGLITVGFIIERLTGRGLDEFINERLLVPLGLRETMYNPLAQSLARVSTGAAMPPSSQDSSASRSDWLPRIAPTEIDTLFRKQHMHGRVHDENAFAMGGVSGHAGLFSSARDLAVFAQMLLNGGFYGGRRILSADIIDRFRRHQNEFSSRALGWDTPAACGLGTAAGDYFSSQSIGHTGFTGTSIWVDFERDLFVVLLTNRVNPGRANQMHVPLRRAVHDAVQQAVVDPSVSAREWVSNPRLRRACQ